MKAQRVFDPMRSERPVKQQEHRRETQRERQKRAEISGVCRDSPAAGRTCLRSPPAPRYTHILLTFTYKVLCISTNNIRTDMRDGTDVTDVRALGLVDLLQMKAKTFIETKMRKDQNRNKRNVEESERHRSADNTHFN